MMRWIVRWIERIPLSARRRILALYVLALFIGTHTPRVDFGPGVAGFSADKLLHGIAFLGLALLMMSARLVAKKSGLLFVWRNILWCAAGALACGAAIEISQDLFVPGRQAHALDMACNAAGVAGAVVIAGILRSGESRQ